MDRGAWWATVHRVIRSWTGLSDQHFELAGGTSGKESASQCKRQERQIPSLGQEGPLEEAWQPTPGFLPGQSRGQTSLGAYGPQGCKVQDTPEAAQHKTSLVDHLVAEIKPFYNVRDL